MRPAVVCSLGSFVFPLLAVAAHNTGPAVQNGSVRSGNSPIVGSTVTLYRAGPEIGSNAVVLGTAQSGPAGQFTIHYTPPAEADVVLYLIADGPQDGIRLATVLGTDDFPNNIRINERSTVATAYTMAQFINGENIGGKSPGPQNAGAILRNLVDLKTGGVGHVLRTPPNGSQTSTWPTFNSLANMLAGCVSGEVDCAMLFLLATPPGGPAPHDTLQAMVNIAHRPWDHNTELWALSEMSVRFHPALREAPVTWTLALKYVGNGHEFDGPGATAIDEHGNVWANNNYTFRNNHSVVSCDSKLLSKLTPTGEDFPGAPYTGGGLSGAGFGITLDPDGNVWVGNFGFFGSTCPCDLIPLANSVSKIGAAGEPISPPGGYQQGCINAPQATVSDQTGGIWLANQCGGTVTRYRNGDPNDYWIYDVATDQLIDPQVCPPFSGEGPKPFGLAIDRDGNAWVSNNAGANATDTVFKLSPDGQLLASVGVNEGINRPMGVCTDRNGNVWVSNSAIVSLPCAACDFVEDYGDLSLADEAFFSVSQFDSDGTPIRELHGGGLFIPWGNAVDGAGNVWIANFGRQRVSQFSGATGEPIAPQGYHSDALQRNTGVSIDPSGNVWLTNNWLLQPELTNPGGDGLVVFIGLAAPVQTPVIGPPHQP